jgi:predicted Zn finger-like uncharacterized protein
MSLLTRCTHCHTVFRITAEQLQAHGGKVRCGRCLQVFDGMIALAPDAPVVPAPGIPQPLAATTETAAVAEAVTQDPAPSSMLSGEPAQVMQPELEPAAQDLAVTTIITTDTGPLPEVQPEAPVAVPEQDSVIEHEAERVATAAENPFIHAADMAEPVNRPWLAAAGIVLAVVLAGQAIFFYRSEIAAGHPLARQWLNAACAEAGCTMPLPRVTKPVLIEASDLQRVDPAHPDRIQLTATLRNHAGHDVAYPALDLVLTNATDHTLARRIFLPADYLGSNRDPHGGLTANAELTVRLTLDTGSLGAAGFRLALLPAPLR